MMGLTHEIIMPRSRRALLKTAGFTLGSGTLASMSGCLSDSPAGSDNTTTNSSSSSSSTPDPSEKPTATEAMQWIPNPQNAPLRDGIDFLYFDIASIRSKQEYMHENAYSQLETEMLRPVWRREYVNVAAVDAVMTIGHINVIFGSFDREAIAENISPDSQSSSSNTTSTQTTGPSWSEPESYEGFDLYGSSLIYAISEDVLIDASPMVSPTRDDPTTVYVKTVIDAPSGDSGYYDDGNEYVAAMMGVVEDPDALWCYPEAMDGSTSRGFRKDVITGGLQSWRFGSETTHLTWANTYPDAETAESGELADYIQSESDRFGAYNGIDVTVEGNLAWTTGTIPTEDFNNLMAGDPDEGNTTDYTSYRNP